MSEAKHTAGPWRFEPAAWNTAEELNSGNSRGSIVADRRDESSWYIARVDDAPGEEANAHLIAAAPDLLESLKEIVALTDRKTDIWDKAHAAIDRAEGR